MVQVQMPHPTGGSGLGKLIGIGAGLLTGNPMMVAGGVTAGTQAGNLLGAYSMGKDLLGKTAAAPSPTPMTDQNFKMPEIGESQFGTSDDALSRRLTGTPQNQFSLGMQSLQNPNVPLDYRMVAAPSYFAGQSLNPKGMFTDISRGGV